jgi:lysophospholipase L1-like esterase
MGLLDAPPVSPALVRRATNAAYSVQVVTDAARQAMTPGPNDIVLTSDAFTFWIGDGATVGGVAHSTGLTNQQAVRSGIIQPRTRDLGARIRTASAAFGGLGVGNSIIAGTGSSSASNTWLWKVQVALQAATSIGTASSWFITNVGVGGSQILVPLGYAADHLTSAGAVQASLTRTSRPAYALVMTMRNDLTTPAQAWVERCRTLIRGLQSAVDDVIVVAEPPRITYATGVIEDGPANNWSLISSLMQEVCADYGCTYVDVWTKWVAEAQAGADLRLRMVDGVHPNDVGHAMIANLVAQAMLMPVVQTAGRSRDRASTEVGQFAVPVASYTPVAASVSPTSFSGLSSATTARRVQLAEGANNALQLTTGQTARYDIPLPIYRIRPIVVQGNAASGSMAIDGATLIASISASAGSPLELPGGNGVPSTPRPGVIVITGTSTAPLMLLGVQVDTMQAADQHAAWPGATESGTWSAQTFAATGAASGQAVRKSSTVGDYVDITWYGTSLCFAVETGTDRGMVTEVTDGGSTTTHDGYASTASYLYRWTGAKAVGWHTTRLTVTTKNASSSGQTIALGNFKTTIPPDASIAYVAVSGGETMPLHGRWRVAAIDRVVSGSPSLQWTPSATSLVVSGSGVAIVRLER